MRIKKRTDSLFPFVLYYDTLRVFAQYRQPAVPHSMRTNGQAISLWITWNFDENNSPADVNR